MIVTPAKAGVQCNRCNPRRPWIPAFAGMTAESVSSRASRSVSAFPASVRDVDDDAVGASPFLLEIGVAAGPHHRVDVVLGGQPLAARAFDLLAGRVEVVDLEAEMVNAGEVWSVRAHVGRLLALSGEDRNVDMAVGQKDRTIGAAPQLLEAERRFVELGDFRRLLGRQRDVLDACHGLPPMSISSSPRKRESRAPRLRRLPWTPAFAGVTV